MKTKNVLLVVAVITLGFTACKSETEAKAEKTIDTYAVYVDSITNVAAADMKTHWESIETGFEKKTAEAEAAIVNLKDKVKTDAEAKLAASKAKYAELKAKLEKEKEAEKKASEVDKIQVLRNSLFGQGKVGADMKFDWVNKDNILSVYEQFVNTVAENKDKYSREDWDEVKAMYEALDSRKNTVEKEGLTSKDNFAIAKLKLKFAPMYTVNRMGAKAEENAEAKK